MSFLSNASSFYAVFKRSGKQEKYDRYLYVEYNESVNRLDIVKLHSNLYIVRHLIQ